MSIAATAKPDRAVRHQRRLGLTPRGWILAISVVILAYLEIAPRVGWVDSFLLPPLSTILVHTGQLLVNGGFWATHLLPTLYAMGLSFVIASALGILAGLFLWRFPKVRRVFDPWLVVYYAIPIFAIYPMIVVMAGIGTVPIVFLATLLAIVAVITATMDGLDTTPHIVLKLSNSLRLSPVARTVKILLPSAVEQINVGLRLALSFSIIGVLASEFILSTHGLGYFISYQSELFAMGDMYGGIALVLIIAFSFNIAFSALLGRRTRRIQG